MTSVEELGQLAADCELLAYDCTVPIDDRLILIKLAEDLWEAQFAKMASQPYTLADVLPEPANISTAPSKMPAAAKWFLAVTLASVAGVLMFLGVFQLVQLLTE